MINKLWKNIYQNERNSVWKKFTTKKTSQGEDEEGEQVFDIDNMMRTIDQENTENLEVFNKKLNKRYQQVPMHIVSAVATKRLFDLYTDKEIGEVLHYFGQIKEKEV